MSIASQIMRPDRLHRFAEVWRTEGPGRAVSAALRHSRRIALHEGRTGMPTEALPSSETTHPGHAFTPLWRDMARADAFHMPSAPATLRRSRSVAMIGDLNLPQCRKYRVEQLDELFAAAGVSYRFSHYEDIPRCLDVLQDATHLFLYRIPAGDLATMYAYEARRLKLPVLYDIDDPLFSVSAYETYGNMTALPEALKSSFIAQAPGYLAVMNMADAVSVSTPGLVAHAREYTARPVWLRRNFCDEATLSAGRDAREAGRSRQDGFRVAFASGSQGHEVDFSIIADDIVRFLDHDPTRRLMILGRFDTALLPDGLADRMICKPFTNYAGYLKWLAAADCAVMPLADDSFNRAKSAVRVIDASAVGVASLVSDVGDLAPPVRDGVTGHVMAAGESWFDKLEALARDRPACHAMGKAALEVMQSDWSARADMPVVDPELLRWIRD